MKYCLSCFKEIPDELEVCPYCGYIEGTPAEEAIHMEPGTILANRYIIGKVIGFGGFGVTYVAWDGKLEQRVAIKEYLPSEFSTRMPGQSSLTIFNGEKSEQYRLGLNKFVDEARRLAKFQNEDGIVKIFDCISENETAYIIMEYLDGETLTSMLRREKRIPEDMAVNMMLPIMHSLKVVHQEGILHRDIAPDNIFITKDGGVKLIDFGASRFATTTHSRSLTVIVKPGYSPEEQYRSRGDQGEHTDVYSVAATLYKMVTGVTPPDALERRAKIENTRKDIIEDPRKVDKGISLRFENAVMNALNVQIEDRTATIEQLEEELKSDVPVARRYGKIKKIDFYRWPLWLKIAVPSLLSIVLVFGVLLLTGVISFKSLFSSEVKVPEGYTIVPQVEGKDADEALQLISDNKLLCKTGGNVESAYVASNLIVYQTPNAGTFLVENGTVEVVISKGTGKVETAKDGVSIFPFVTWSEENVATNDVTTAGLTYRLEYIYDDVVAKGQIIRATLADGTEVNAGDELPEGTEVILYVSMGPEGKAMISVLGMKSADAQAALQELGVVVSVEMGESDDYNPDEVFYQSVNLGETVQQGDEVVIRVVAEKKEELFEVPNVVGMKSDAAKTKLKDSNLKVSVVENNSNSVPEGLIISQKPSAGSSQPKDATVVIEVSKGPVKVKVPNVVGMKEDAAGSTLANAGLTSSVSYDTNENVEPGIVIRQSVSPDEKVVAKTNVEITVSLGSQYTIVPNVIGYSETDAVSAMQSVGLTCNISHDYSEEITIGKVARQSAAGGDKVLPGSKIDVVISDGTQYTTVPNLVGKSEKDAIAALDSIKLKSSVSYEFNESQVKGLVISQSTTAGDKLKFGTSVNLVISKGSEYVTIPNVVGMNEATSTSTLSNAGVAYEINRVEDDSVPMDTVISQSETGKVSVRGRENTGVVVKVTISRGYYPTAIALSQSTASISMYGTVDLDYSYTPANTTVDNCKWSSSDTSVATVDNKGIVTGVYPGSATITATSYTVDGTEIKATCSVTVNPPTLSLSQSTVDLGEEHGGNSGSLSFSVSAGTAQNVTVSSSNTSIATVSLSGNTIAVNKMSRGTTTVSVSCDVGGYKLNASFTVRCYEYVYSGWGDWQRTTDKPTKSDWSIEYDAGRGGASGNWEATGNKNIVRCKLIYHVETKILSHSPVTYERRYDLSSPWIADTGFVECDLNGTPTGGWVEVAPGGTYQIPGYSSRFLNVSDRTGYANNPYTSKTDQKGVIWFPVEYQYEDIYATYYYYHERTRWLSCD